MWSLWLERGLSYHNSACSEETQMMIQDDTACLPMELNWKLFVVSVTYIIMSSSLWGTWGQDKYHRPSHHSQLGSWLSALHPDSLSQKLAECTAQREGCAKWKVGLIHMYTNTSLGTRALSEFRSPWELVLVWPVNTVIPQYQRRLTAEHPLIPKSSEAQVPYIKWFCIYI